MKRTNQQNKAIHKYFEMVAEALNDAGFDIEKTLSKYNVDIPWTKESVKSLMWKPVQRSMYAKASTTELDRSKEITEIYEVINRFLGKLGIHVPFPHENNPDTDSDVSSNT